MSVINDSTIDEGKSPAEIFAFVFLRLQGARFDFDAKTIESILNKYYRAVSIDNVGTVFDVFAKISRGDRRLYSDSDVSQIFANTHVFKLRQLIVQALWLEPNPNSGRLLAELSLELIQQDPTDPISYMRYAEGLRRGQHYLEAVEILDDGLSRLDSREVLVNQDFVRQRMMVMQELQSEKRFEHKVADFEENLSDVVEKLTDEMREESQKMLFRSIELLGLFIALLGVIAGTVGMAFVGDLDWWERALVMLSSSTMVVGFFCLILFITRKQK